MNFENLIKNVSDNNESLTNTIKCSNLIICEFWENVKFCLVVDMCLQNFIDSKLFADFPSKTTESTDNVQFQKLCKRLSHLEKVF